MTQVQWPLQKAVHASLSADPNLVALIGDPPRIHDQAPERPVFPFLTVGQARVRPHPKGPSDLEQHEINIHAWSRWGGRKEVKEIADAVRARLHHGSLDLSADGLRLITLAFVFADVFPRAGGDVHQAVIRFGAALEPTAALV